MKKALFVVLSLVAVAGFAATTKPAAKPTAKPAATAAKSTGWAAKMEQLAATMLPQERVDKMMGFFGPVVKKYLPVFQQFQGEYTAAAKKLPVVTKYLPKADAALAEAKAMKVPAKYEAEKAEYIGEVEAFLTVVKMSAALANRLSAKPPSGK